MQDIIIWHNPRCSKSRSALAYLDKKGIIPTVVKYMDEIPNEERIKEILTFLNIEPRSLMRTKEEIYSKLNLKDEESDEKLIKAMTQNPKLIERPVIINGDKAVIARPLENIDKIL